MPIIIRELVIRATVQAAGGQGQAPAAGGKGGQAKEENSAAVVDQVMQILERKEER